MLLIFGRHGMYGGMATLDRLFLSPQLLAPVHQYTAALQDFLYFSRSACVCIFLCMMPDERIRQLCAQLFRAEHPAVIDTVAAQLHAAVEEFSQWAKSRNAATGSTASM